MEGERISITVKLYEFIVFDARKTPAERVRNACKTRAKQFPGRCVQVAAAASGFRPADPGQADIYNRDFLCTIESDDLANSSGLVNYKSANTDVLAWIVERVSKKSLQTMLLEIIEAAVLEHTFYMSTYRAGVPNTNGGGCMTARDLARYGLIFARQGQGIS